MRPTIRPLPLSVWKPRRIVARLSRSSGWFWQTATASAMAVSTSSASSRKISRNSRSLSSGTMAITTSGVASATAGAARVGDKSICGGALSLALDPTPSAARGEPVNSSAASVWVSHSGSEAPSTRRAVSNGGRSKGTSLLVAGVISKSAERPSGIPKPAALACDGRLTLVRVETWSSRLVSGIDTARLVARRASTPRFRFASSINSASRPSSTRISRNFFEASSPPSSRHAR